MREHESRIPGLYVDGEALQELREFEAKIQLISVFISSMLAFSLVSQARF